MGEEFVAVAGARAGLKPFPPPADGNRGCGAVSDLIPENGDRPRCGKLLSVADTGGREKGSSLNSAFLTPKPLASSVYVHVPEAHSPHERLISVMSRFPFLSFALFCFWLERPRAKRPGELGSIPICLLPQCGESLPVPTVWHAGALRAGTYVTCPCWKRRRKIT